MEIKTTEDIMYEYVDEEDHCLRLYDINPNVQWVRVEDVIIWIEKWDTEEWIKSDDLIKKLDKVWHKINTCKMDKLRDNFITKTQVASYLSELRNALTSNSANAKTHTGNRR